MPFHPLNGPVAIGGSDIQSVKTEIKSQNDHQTLDKRRIDFLQLDYRISHSCYVKANTGKLFILVNPSRVISGGSVPYCYFKAPVGHPDRAGRRLLGACSFLRPTLIYLLCPLALPGSTNPERLTTVHCRDWRLGPGCCFTWRPAPIENPDTCGVRFRSEQRLAPHSSSRTQRVTGVQCQHNHRPAGNFKFVAATDRVNESRTPSGTAPGARAEPVKPCPAFTLSGGPAPSREGEFQLRASGP